LPYQYISNNILLVLKEYTCELYKKPKYSVLWETHDKNKPLVGTLIIDYMKLLCVKNHKFDF